MNENMTIADIEALERIADWAENHRNIEPGIHGMSNEFTVRHLRDLALEIALAQPGLENDAALLDQLDAISALGEPKLTALQFAAARAYVTSHIKNEYVRNLWLIQTQHGGTTFLLSFYRADREKPGAMERWYENGTKEA